MPRFINSSDLIQFLNNNADELSMNSEALRKAGKFDSAEVDESIAIYLRECLIDELADRFGIELK